MRPLPEEGDGSGVQGAAPREEEEDQDSPGLRLGVVRLARAGGKVSESGDRKCATLDATFFFTKRLSGQAWTLHVCVSANFF